MHSSKQNLTPRPIAACLGSSAKASFPFLLVLGREYNGNGIITHQHDKYCFSESPRSIFWNRTYAFIERNCHESSFKKNCIEFQRSPVVLSNVMPRPTPNKKSNIQKTKIRSSTPENEIHRHVQAIFELSITQRYKAVIISTGDRPEFETANKLIFSECDKRDLPFIEIPYLGSRASNEETDAKISQEETKTFVLSCQISIPRRMHNFSGIKNRTAKGCSTDLRAVLSLDYT